MRNLVQDHIGLGSAVERRAVPVEAWAGSRRMNRHTEMPRNRERLPPMPLSRCAGRAIGCGGADGGEGGARGGVIEPRRKAIERRAEPVARDRSQNHPLNIGAAKLPAAGLDVAAF